MNERTCKVFKALVAAVAGFLMMLTGVNSVAQVTVTQEVQKTVENDSGRVSVKMERGTKIAVDNRTSGRITLIGWDQDHIEATATSERGEEIVKVKTAEDSSGKTISFDTDYADREQFEMHGEARLKGREARLMEREVRRQERAAARADLPSVPSSEAVPSEAAVPASPKGAAPSGPPVQTPPSAPPDQAPGNAPFKFNFRPREIHIELKIPRHAEIELIKVIKSDVEVTGIDTPITITGNRSTIKLNRVGAAEVRTRSGPVEVENASGLVDVITTSGSITVRNAGGDVRALSISGDVDIQCARGRVNVSNTDGFIRLLGIGGDVDATTTNGEVSFAGAIREDGRYHLKSMSGKVGMAVRSNAPGFTAALSSYRGQVGTDFSLKIKRSAAARDPLDSAGTPADHRVIGRYGNGQAQITLDSFDGAVNLSKLAPGAAKDCN